MTIAARTFGHRHGSAVVTLPSDTEILITRAFDAPPDLVFTVWTTPELVSRWWTADRASMRVCDIDLRVGGAWRYVIDDSGRELGWHGVYRRIERPTLLESTEVFEGYPDATAVNTMVLEERDGVTTMRVRVVHASKANRDGHLNSGMEPGMQIVLNRFEDLLADERARIAS